MVSYTYSTFLSLTNQVLAELNEVPLNTTTFPIATGFSLVAKNAVNKAIRLINSQQYEWPFNHVYGTQVLTPGTQFYALPANAKLVDFDSFVVGEDQTLPNPQTAQYLPQISYDEFLQKYYPQDLQSTIDSSLYAPPLLVVPSQAQQFIVTPIPDQAYTITFDYWQTQTDMVNATDLCTVPDRFDYNTVEGAMYYCYKFRENLEAAGTSMTEFEKGIKFMRYVYISDYIRLTDSRAGPQFRQRYF